MLHTRSIRRRFAWAAMLGIFCSQLAVSAHACPMDSGMPDMGASQAAPSDASVSTGKDEPAGTGPVCLMHCQDEQQNVGDGGATHAAPALATTPVTIAGMHAVALPAAAHRNAILVRSTSPPLSIRNCCFRI